MKLIHEKVVYKLKVNDNVLGSKVKDNLQPI